MLAQVCERTGHKQTFSKATAPCTCSNNESFRRRRQRRGPHRKLPLPNDRVHRFSSLPHPFTTCSRARCGWSTSVICGLLATFFRYVSSPGRREDGVLVRKLDVCIALRAAHPFQGRLRVNCRYLSLAAGKTSSVLASPSLTVVSFREKKAKPDEYCKHSPPPPLLTLSLYICPYRNSSLGQSPCFCARVQEKLLQPTSAVVKPSGCRASKKFGRLGSLWFYSEGNQ